MAFTYFFRDWQTLDLLIQHALPELKQNKYINIWDAGCAMGPEPYTLAIMLRENMGYFLFRNVRIYATDIDESGHFGEIIAAGIYPNEQIQRIPPDIQARYFSPDGKEGYCQISDEIKKSVTFQFHDLLSLKPIREDLGLIICKNVLLHFTAEQRIDVIKMFHRALMPGGYFVTEQTQKLPPETQHLFRQITNAGQVFQKV